MNNDEKPYIEEIITTVDYSYNPKYGDDRICKCGHRYYKHFDTYWQMQNVGCKYCECYHFIEEEQNNNNKEGNVNGTTEDKSS